LWQGVPVPGHAVFDALRQQAASWGGHLDERVAPTEMRIGGVRLRILHPPPPDWERRQVRNDDSVVLELLYHDVAVLLPGDISSTIERQILPQLAPARTRLLKVAHHGSRTSTSPELLAAWPPDVAVISAGRGNTFGHPAPDVVQRLEASGAAIYRTDQDGQVTIETDGQAVSVRTFVGERR
jgi:competence protein ComEC